MANAIERLFDQVLTRLSPQEPPFWRPEITDDDRDNDPIWRDDLGAEDDGIFSLDEIAEVNNALDSLRGSRVAGLTESEEIEIFGGGIRHRGMEVLAFYKSRRFLNRHPFRGRWGIFYLRQGLMYLEHEIERAYPGFGNPRALAIDFLRAHERFHYQADVQTLLFETVLGRQMYEPVRWAFRGRASHFVEEALANRQAWDWARKADIEEFAFDFMKLQPNAYARFDEDRVELASEWAGVVVDRLHPSKASRNDLAHWVESPPKIYLRRSLCPEYVVFPTDLSKWISTALRLPPVKQIQEAVPVLRLLTGRFANLKAAWEETKRKLLVEALARGLNFKPWPKAGRDCCSVRVDQNFRAHLRHLGAGVWEVFEIGPHTKLGHG